MNIYKSSAELKGMAKEQLFGKYGTVIGAVLLVGIFNSLLVFIPNFITNTGTIPGLIIYYLVSFILSLFAGIFSSGRAFLFLKVTCRQPVSAGDIFYGFKAHPDKALVIQFVLALASYLLLAPLYIFNYLFASTQNVIYFLMMSVFCILGYTVLVIISLMLSQSFFLLQDFPQYSAKELMKMSCRIMKGHKGRLFYIQLSFLPLYLLGILSCCIAFLWIVPYINTTMANFYMDLMKNRNQTETSMPDMQ